MMMLTILTNSRTNGSLSLSQILSSCLPTNLLVTLTSSDEYLLSLSSLAFSHLLSLLSHTLRLPTLTAIFDGAHLPHLLTITPP